MQSKYWEKGKYNVVETVVSNMVSGIFKTPFDKVLLVDSIRDDVLKSLKDTYESFNSSIRVHNCYDGEEFIIHESCLGPIQNSIGDIDKVFYISLLSKNIIDGKLYTIDKKFDKNGEFLIYVIDLSHPDNKFITPLFLVKDEMEELFSWDIDLFGQDFVFNPPINGYSTNPYERSTYLANILHGNLDIKFPIDLVVKGNNNKLETAELNYKNLSMEDKLNYLKCNNIKVFKVLDGRFKMMYFSLPCYEAFFNCVFERKFYHNINS